MLALETAVLLLTALILISNGRQAKRPSDVIRDFLLIAAAAWFSEESAILIYKFYAYSPAWSIFLDRVPAVVIAVWPVVILSARDLSLQITRDGGGGRRVLLGGVIVLADAALIEPLAVEARLWSWKTSGVFGVPTIGILGWAYFGSLCMLALETGGGAAAKRTVQLAAWIAPVFGVHLMLMVSWWGVFRWVQGPMGSLTVTSCAWILSLLLVARILSQRTGRHIQRRVLLLRLPAAALLFSLFALMEAPSALLVAYAAAFVPPYLVLMAQQYIPSMQRK